MPFPTDFTFLVHGINMPNTKCSPTLHASVHLIPFSTPSQTAMIPRDASSSILLNDIKTMFCWCIMI